MTATDGTLPASLLLNRSIVEQIREHPGIKVLETAPAFAATAADAPWGTWEYHPMEEQYVDLAIRLARMAGDDVGHTIAARHMISMRQVALGARKTLEAESEARAQAERRALPFGKEFYENLQLAFELGQHHANLIQHGGYIASGSCVIVSHRAEHHDLAAFGGDVS